MINAAKHEKGAGQARDLYSPSGKIAVPRQIQVSGFVHKASGVQHHSISNYQ
jgi:hypothetical protein